MRFISLDSVEYKDYNTLGGLNLFVYCNNNPIMNTDENGTDWWSNFWSSIRNGFATVGTQIASFFSSTFGANISSFYNTIIKEYNYFFAKVEIGTTINATINYSNSFFNLIINIPADLWRIDDYEIGININAKVFSTTLSAKLLDVKFSIANKNNDQYYMSFSPIDITLGRTKNKDGIVTYEEIQFDLITIGIVVGAAAVVIFLLGSAIGTVTAPLVSAFA